MAPSALVNKIRELYLVQGDSDKEIEIVLELTEALFTDNRYDLVDEFLIAIDVYRLGPISLEGILRSTYRFQHTLPNWEYFLGEARTAMKSLGKDVDFLFVGLMVHPKVA